jgi:hypothetical protein
MNFRHAAALVLVGWYLMAPPFDRASQTIRKEVPFSEWINLRAMNSRWEGEFHSQQQCESFRSHFLSFYKHQSPDFQKSIANETTYRQHQLGKCVASNDPRFKEK